MPRCIAFRSVPRCPCHSGDLERTSRDNAWVRAFSDNLRYRKSGNSLPPPSKPERPLTWLAKYLSLGLTLPASVVAGYLVGSAGDHYFHLPLLRAIGILLGMVAGLTQVFKEVMRDERRTGSRQ